MHEDFKDLVRLPLALETAMRWEADPTSITAVQQSENFVFRFRDRNKRERYLRIAPPNYRPRNEIEGELDFVRHLHAKKVPVAAPVMSLNKNWVETIRIPEGNLYAVVFEAVSGTQMRWGTEMENRQMVFERGKALGRMHRAARSYKPSGKHQRFHWFEDDLFLQPDRFLGKADPAARREYEELIQWMLDRPATKENYGIVHGDFGSGNTFRQKDGSLVAFDFEDCLHHWFIYDLAVSIRSARTMPTPTRKRYLRIMVEGYGDEKDLGSDGIAEVAQFCRLAALYRYVAVLRDVEGKRLTRDDRKLLTDRLDVLRNPPSWR